jgi:TonB family protein
MSAAVPVKDQNGEPIVRNGMRAHSLNSAAPIFAAYLNAMHNRIHPEFAEKELPKLDALPKDVPSSDKKLAVRLEIVMSAEDGRVVKIGIAKTSGVTAFDTAALDSVQRAQPFGRAPGAIASADGNVYVDWVLHRDEVLACSTMYSRPFLLAP